MNAARSGLHEILGDRIVGDAHWSPNGDEIVFDTPRGPNPDGPTDIYTVSADGTGLTALTDDAARDLSPTWSPDGTKIVFSSDRDGRRQIFVMNADGSEVTKVTSGESAAAFPSWGTQPTTSTEPTPAGVSSNRRPFICSMAAPTTDLGTCTPCGAISAGASHWSVR